MRMRRGACLLVSLIAAMLGFGSPAEAMRAAPPPLTVIRQYLRSLAVHDPAGVCRTFSPQLVAFTTRWEETRTCVQALAGDHFSRESPGYGVRRITIVGAPKVTTDRYGTVGVHVILRYRFACLGAAGVIPGCRPHFARIPDVIYLRSERGGWRIVKPGLVYANTAASAPPWLDALSPPGDEASVNRAAVIGPPPIGCPHGGRTVVNRARFLYPTVGARPTPVPARRAPWLHIIKTHFVWLARDQLCVAMTLAAPPLNASSYTINFGQPQGGGELVDSYGLDIDGTGGLSVRLHDDRRSYRRPASWCPTGVGLAGSSLTFVISPPDRGLDLGSPTDLDAGTFSGQPGEPLLRHPLDAGDDVPSLFGLSLPPARRDLPRCVRFPSAR